MTIISMQASQREKERKELKLKQKKQMELNLVENTNKNYKSVQDATNDRKMVNLLNEVRKSDATIDTDYARYNGTSIYNPPLGKKLKYLEKETIDKIEQDFPTQLHGKKPKPRKKKKQVDTDDNKKEVLNSSKSIKEEKSRWDVICEQLDKPRWKPSRSSLFGGIRKSSSTYQKETILTMNKGEA
jgi:hypothetical protein